MKLTAAGSNKTAKKRVGLSLAARPPGRMSIRTGSALFFAIFLTVPITVVASVQITEIMYDLPGADAGREWVEVTNVGEAAIDITGYRLAEGGTNHTLTLISGSLELLPGQSAVIADNKDKFLADWPSYSGVLIDSSFSLSNTGETIEFKNNELVTLDSASYTSDGGAAGDGNSLHRIGSTLVPGAPNPGVYTASAPAPAPEPEPEPEPEPQPGSAPTSSPATTPAASSTASTPTSASTTTHSPTSATAQTNSTSERPQDAAPSTTAAAAATKSAEPLAAAAPTSAKTVASSQTGQKNAPKSKSASKTGGKQAAATSYALAEETSPLRVDPLWFYIAGLLGVIALGIAGVLLVPMLQGKKETKSKGEEFDIIDS